MKKVKIKSVQLRLGGVKGLKMEFVESLSGDGIEFKGEIKGNYSKPVQGRLKKVFEQVSDHLVGVIGLQAGVGVRCSKLQSVGRVMDFEVEVTCLETDRVSTMKVVVGENECGCYPELMALCKEGKELAKDYMMKAGSMDYGQLLLDLQVEMPKIEVGDINGMSKKEKLEKAQELLEKHGYCVMSGGDDDEVEVEILDVEEGEEEDPETGWSQEDADGGEDDLFSEGTEVGQAIAENDRKMKKVG